MIAIRRLGVTLILGVLLALPTSAFAASASGTVNESGTVAVSVSATIPTSATYTATGNVFTSSIPVTAVSSTFSGGLSVNAMPNSGGGGVFDPSKRTIVLSGTGWTPTAGAASMGYWSSATSKVIGTKATDATNDSLTLASSIQVTAAGTYTGTLSISVITSNP